MKKEHQQCKKDNCTGIIDFDEHIEINVEFRGETIGALVHPCTKCGEIH
jgi:hypothetical protein